MPSFTHLSPLVLILYYFKYSLVKFIHLRQNNAAQLVLQ